MKLYTLKSILLEYPDHFLRPLLPDGDAIPAGFHVTEVGHVTRRSIDCGGTVRVVESCLLQTWVPQGDNDHRLTAGKLARILDLSMKVLPSDGLDVEVEYDCCVVAQYTIESADASDGVLTFNLGNKKTDCLAKASCGVNRAEAATGCCGNQACGCS